MREDIRKRKEIGYSCGRAASVCGFNTRLFEPTRIFFWVFYWGKNLRCIPGDTIIQHCTTKGSTLTHLLPDSSRTTTHSKLILTQTMREVLSVISRRLICILQPPLLSSNYGNKQPQKVEGSIDVCSFIRTYHSRPTYAQKRSNEILPYQIEFLTWLISVCGGRVRRHEEHFKSFFFKASSFIWERRWSQLKKKILQKENVFHQGYRNTPTLSHLFHSDSGVDTEWWIKVSGSSESDSVTYSNWSVAWEDDAWECVGRFEEKLYQIGGNYTWNFIKIGWNIL